MNTLTERYDLCRKEIAGRFYEGRDPGEIVNSLETGDRHLRGEAVLQLRTAGGETLYYKPRDCWTSELLGDINALLFGKRLVPAQVTGDGFAFQKREARRIPDSDEEKASFYTWMGRLTAVFCALGSVDMHVGNVLCCGGLPVVVDTETLLYPRARDVSGAGEFSAAYGEAFPDYSASVGECMVLPRFYAFLQRSPLLLLSHASPDAASAESQDTAGRILSALCERKKATGCFRVYPNWRKQYFLPSFLRGSTGIAYVLLRYAALQL